MKKDNLENKRVDPVAPEPFRPAQQKMVKVKLRPGRAVEGAHPGDIISVTESYATHLRVTGYADPVEE